MNWDILGHEWAVSLLQENLRRGRPRHAYLFTGPEGIGRRTLAIRLAQALNCPQPSQPGVPCRECRTCQQFANLAHPDLHLVQAEFVGGILKVDQVRELQHRLSLAPYEARYRIALLLRFEEANDNAANALLKTLEEPPPQVILILTADNPERLLPTISSRCEHLRLRQLSIDSVRAGLETRWGVPTGQAELLAHISGGRPGYALRLYQEPDRLRWRESCLNEQSSLLSSTRVERFAYAEKLARSRDLLRETLGLWYTLWRDVMLLSSGSDQPFLNPDRGPEIQFLATHLELAEILATLQGFERTVELIDRNINPRLAFEIFLLDLPSLRIENSTAPAA
jgi:DNA polymerase-3 subunit delta'